MTAPNHVDIVRFGPNGALMALKHVHLVKRSLYIYSVRNFLPYLMWDVTNTPLPMQTQCPRYVPRDYGVKQINTHYGAKKTPTPGSGIGSNTICNDPLPTM